MSGCQNLQEILLGYDEEELEVILGDHLEFSPDIPFIHKHAVLDAFSVLLAQEIEAEPGSLFEKVFGGTTTSDIITYLEARIHYIISHNELRERERAVERGSEEATLWESFTEALTEPVPRSAASNVGVSLWFRKFWNGQTRQVVFPFGDREIPVHSTRVGIVSIADGYARGNEIYRISALIHEARHSDCTGGITRIGLRRMRSYPPNDQRYPKACGHLHVVCPWDDMDADTPDRRCDGHPWGAIAIEVVYLDAVIDHCGNCSRHLKKQARDLRDNRLDRILLDEDLFQGDYGDPNMSSWGLR